MVTEQEREELRKKSPVPDGCIFQVIGGSHAYGCNIPESDFDIRGIYLQSPESVLNEGYREQVTINKDEVYYELRRFLDLACGGNPTMCEILFSPEDCILYKHPVMDILIDNKEKILSKSCKHSYSGYGFSQIKKAAGTEKKMNWEKEKTIRKDILDFCYVIDKQEDFKTLSVKDWLKYNKYKQENCGLLNLPHFTDCYALFYDHVIDLDSTNPRYNPIGYRGIVTDIEKANDVCLSSIPKYSIREAILFFNKNAYSIHCKEYIEYQEWLNKRNVQRYVDVANHNQKLDGKNMLHCVRLIETGIEIAEQKTINVRRPNADYLIGIRKGKYNLKQLLDNSEDMINKMNDAFVKSDLPDKTDRGFFLKLMIKMRKIYYKENTIIV